MECIDVFALRSCFLHCMLRLLPALFGLMSRSAMRTPPRQTHCMFTGSLWYRTYAFMYVHVTLYVDVLHTAVLRYRWGAPWGLGRMPTGGSFNIYGGMRQFINWKFEDEGLKCQFYQRFYSMRGAAPWDWCGPTGVPMQIGLMIC